MKCFLLILSLLSLSVQAQKTEIVIQSGHYKEISSLAFSPNGKYLVSAGEDNNVILWDLKTNKQIRTFRGHKKGVTKVIFTKDSKKVITGGDRNDQQIFVFDVETGEQLVHIEKGLRNSIEALAVSDDGKKLFAGTSYQARLFNMENGEELFEIKDDRNAPDAQRIRHTIEYADFSSDGKTIAFGVQGLIHLRETSTGKFLKSLDAKSHRGQVADVRFSKNGANLYSGGSNGQILIWDVKTGALKDSIKNPGSGYPCPCSFSSDLKRYIVSCGSDPQMLDLKTKKVQFELKHELRAIYTMAFNKNDQLLAIAGRNQEDNYSILIYNAVDGHFMYELKGYPGAIKSLDFSSDNKTLLSGSNVRYARAWDLASGSGFSNFSDGLSYPGDIYSTVRFSNDDKYVYQANQNSTYAWRTEDGKALKTFYRGNKQTGNFSVTPDNKGVLYVPGRLLIHDRETGEELHNLQPPRLMVRAVRYSPDGKVLYAAGHKEIKRWKTSDYSELEPLAIKEYAWDMSVNPKGDRLATIEYGEIYVRNSETAAVIKKLDGRFDHVMYSPDKRWLCGTDYDEIRVYDANTLELVRTLKGHTDHINTLRFTSDGKQLASGADDTSILLWDMETGKLIVTMLAIDRENFIMITPDNYYMTSSGGTNAVAFRRGNKMFPFEQFDLHYNRPDIVLDRIGYASKDLINSYKKAHEKRLKKMGFNQSDFEKGFNAPEIELAHSDEYFTKKSTFPIELKAKDEKYKIDRINVWINGVPIYGVKGMSVSDGQQLDEDLKIELANGNNKIDVSVHNTNGVESIRESFRLYKEGEATKPKLFILAIGDSKFKQSDFNLNYAAKDVQDFVALMKKDASFSSVEALEIVDSEVKKDNILKSKSFLEKAGRNDAVIVFIAGHGVLDANFDYYFATYDMDFNDPAGKGVIYEDVEALLDGLKSISKLLIMDTCHSGEIDKDEVELAANTEEVEGSDIVFRAVGTGVRQKDEHLGLQNTSALVKELFTDIRRGTGATVISSAGGVEFAMESDKWNNGLFTYCLLNGISSGKADLDSDGAIMLSEIQKYVKDQVRELSQGKQVPTSRIENIENDYRVW